MNAKFNKNEASADQTFRNILLNDLMDIILPGYHQNAEKDKNK